MLTPPPQLPRDGLETVTKEINLVNGGQTHVIEEGRLRPSYVPPASEHERSTGTFAPAAAAAAAASRDREGDERAGAGTGDLPRQDQPWFARNIVDHRCGARRRRRGSDGDVDALAKAPRVLGF